MVLPFVRALPKKIVEILRFLPPKNFMGAFSRNQHSKGFFTPKPSGVAK